MDSRSEPSPSTRMSSSFHLRRLLAKRQRSMALALVEPIEWSLRHSADIVAMGPELEGPDDQQTGVEPVKW